MEIPDLDVLLRSLLQAEISSLHGKAGELLEQISRGAKGLVVIETDAGELEYVRCHMSAAETMRMLGLVIEATSRHLIAEENS